MTTVSKSKLKAHMLAIFREIEASGEELIITDHGKPVLKVTALQPPPKSADVLFATARAQLQKSHKQFSAEELTETWSEIDPDAQWWS